ncbi:MAG: LON peptidase substrate-binding domain-containing protein [Anaerolineae bacterium]
MEDLIGTIELPLFPLNTVLFPGQVLPLHIFEDRYRLMIRQCLAEDKSFGVVLIRQGQEVGEMAVPHAIGTTARILESSHLDDGTMDIVTVGIERFRIRRLIYDQPYLRGEVELFPLVGTADDPTVAHLTSRVRQQVIRYIELIAEAAGLRIQVDSVPDQPQRVGYLAAVAMQIDNREKQTLLSAVSAEHILTAEISLLNRENALLTWMARTKAWPDRMQFGPGGSLLPN